EAGVGRGRAGNPHMHFLGAGGTHHLDDLPRGGAAHDAVVHEDDALALDVHAVGVVLQLHAQIADRIRRLDEGAADIVVADDAELEGNARSGGISDRGRHAGIRHRYDHVRRYAALARQLYADPLARVIDAAAFDHAVGAREVDILEDAG